MKVINCPEYDGIYDGQGPCWTCQNQSEHCPVGSTKNSILYTLRKEHNSDKRRVLHELIVEISRGVDD